MEGFGKALAAVVKLPGQAVDGKNEGQHVIVESGKAADGITGSSPTGN